MASLAALWLPIVLSALIVFVASSLIHRGPFWHRSDYPSMPREAEVLDALRPLAIPPGDYFIPRASSMKEMGSSDFRDKMTRGPVAVMTVLPNGPLNFNRSLLQWFVFLVVVAIFVALLTSRTLPIGTPYPRVFKVAGTIAFVGYALALCQLSIWYRRSWMLTAKAGLDGLIYAALTAGTFGWLWPR